MSNALFARIVLPDSPVRRVFLGFYDGSSTSVTITCNNLGAFAEIATHFTADGPESETVDSTLTTHVSDAINWAKQQLGLVAQVERRLLFAERYERPGEYRGQAFIGLYTGAPITVAIEFGVPGVGAAVMITGQANDECIACEFYKDEASAIMGIQDKLGLPFDCRI